jgi:hypothetical protein
VWFSQLPDRQGYEAILKGAHLEDAPFGAAVMPSDLTVLEAVGHLHPFLNRLIRSAIRPVFAGTLTLRWKTPYGPAVTLALISEMGAIWTDVDVATLPSPEAVGLAHRYVERLADDLGLCVNRSIAGGIWTVVDRDDRLPTLTDMFYKLDVWADALERLTDGLAVRLTAGAEAPFGRP